MHLLHSYVAVIDKLNYRFGRFAMYLLLVMLAILFWSSVSKVFFRPSLWTLEMAQFVMVGYYMIGGPYSIQMGSNVRMDLLYGRRSDYEKAWIDAFTVICLFVFLCFLLYGGINSLSYSLQFNERSYSAWQPYMWPVKLVMVVGIFLMLLQSVAEFFRDIIKIKSMKHGSSNHVGDA
ncbi:MAG: TRAP transporter small permease subunit [Candidatus Puniceispirillum sp.]